MDSWHRRAHHKYPYNGILLRLPSTNVPVLLLNQPILMDESELETMLRTVLLEEETRETLTCAFWLVRSGIEELGKRRKIQRKQKALVTLEADFWHWLRTKIQISLYTLSVRATTHLSSQLNEMQWTRTFLPEFNFATSRSTIVVLLSYSRKKKQSLLSTASRRSWNRLYTVMYHCGAYVLYLFEITASAWKLTVEPRERTALDWVH